MTQYTKTSSTIINDDIQIACNDIQVTRNDI